MPPCENPQRTSRSPKVEGPPPADCKGWPFLEILARPARLERATSWTATRRSIQLSYGRYRAAHSSAGPRAPPRRRQAGSVPKTLLPVNKMAVGAVYRELVSGPKTLIHRVNTGKSPKFRLPGEASVSDPAPARRPRRRVPCVREQGNFCQRARIPFRAPHAGPRATIVPASSIRELLAF